MAGGVSAAGRIHDVDVGDPSGQVALLDRYRNGGIGPRRRQLQLAAGAGGEGRRVADLHARGCTVDVDLVDINRTGVRRAAHGPIRTAEGPKLPVFRASPHHAAAQTVGKPGGHRKCRSRHDDIPRTVRDARRRLLEVVFEPDPLAIDLLSVEADVIVNGWLGPVLAPAVGLAGIERRRKVRLVRADVRIQDDCLRLARESAGNAVAVIEGDVDFRAGREVGNARDDQVQGRVAGVVECHPCVPRRALLRAGVVAYDVKGRPGADEVPLPRGVAGEVALVYLRLPAADVGRAGVVEIVVHHRPRMALGAEGNTRDGDAVPVRGCARHPGDGRWTTGRAGGRGAGVGAATTPAATG